MPDIIELLPDNIANQIAAGEVIQRPASAVKEMLENAIDAGATQIHLIIKDAGKELIQVNDNGKGMSAVDARLCFERHATSKIKSIDDLFAIRTMGFRGEALASIAAVAQVELKTKTANDEVGTCILIDNSTVRSQEPCQSEVGTSLSVKNLFFNVPARRNFLKSNSVETRHIVDEFIRVAMAYPEIGFQFTNNNSDIFNLEKSKLKQRIISLLGNNLTSKLVPVEEPTDFVQITGFIATPEACTKTRGNQYFFVNNRFIKSAYLNHAVSQAYRELIAKDEFPLFVLFIDIEPKRVDINVHPTKQEIKFEDEQIVYSFVRSAVKHALSKYSIAPTLDFSLDSSIENLTAVTQPFSKQTQEHTKGDFLFQSFTEKGQAHFLNKKEDLRNWKDLYKIQEEFASRPSAINNGPLTMDDSSKEEPFSLSAPTSNIDNSTLSKENDPSSIVHRPSSIKSDIELLPKDDTKLIQEEFKPSYLQINLAYIIVSTKTGFLLVDQHLAHQRILYEQYENINTNPRTIQKCLIPQTFQLSPADAVLLQSILPDLLPLGYEVEEFGKDTFIIQGIPSDLKPGNEIASIEKIMDAFKHSSSEVRLDRRERLIRSLAMQKAIHHGKKLTEAEMENLMYELFLCEQPQLSPIGKKVFAKISSNQIEILISNA